MKEPATAATVGEAPLAVRGRQLSIVLIESDNADAELIVGELVSAGLQLDVVRATNEAQVRAALAKVPGVDAVLCAYQLPELDAFAALEILKASPQEVPLIVVNGGLSEEEAAECMRRGAADYILKGDLGRLPHALTQALHHARAERDSRDVLRKYLSLFENLPMALLEATAEGEILHANLAAVEMFGFPDLESLLATSVFDLYVEPEERRTLLARLETEGHVSEFECRMRRADGSEFWFSRVVHAVPVEDGTFVVWETIGRDMSERKEVQLALAKSEEHLRSLLAGAPVAVTSMDRDGYCTFAGGSLFSNLGVDPLSIVGLRVADAFPDRVDFVELLAAALERDVETTADFAGRTLHIRCSPFRLTRDAEVIGVRAVAVDITERVEADRALRQSEEVFRLLFEQSAVGISLRDVPRDGLAAPPRWNSRMREMLGVDSNTDEGSRRSMFQENEEEEIEDRLSRLLSGEIHQVRERRQLTRPDGKTIWADLSIVLLRDRDQQPLRFQTMALDITEQVEAEQTLSKRVAHETLLRELSRAGLEGRETANFLATAVELVAHGTGTQFGTILELGPSDDSLVRVAAHGFSEPIPPDLISANTVLRVVDALKTETAAIAIDYQAQPEFDRSHWMIEHGVVASMVVGIYGPMRPFGALSVHTTVPRQFSEDDIEFMRTASTIIGVAIDRKRAEQQRRMLLSRLVTAQEAERRSIAEDIHDDAVQVMTAANMRLELFRLALTDRDQVEAAQKLQETISLSIGRLRTLLFELIPPDLERHGLAAAVRRHLEQCEADAGLAWELQAELDEEPAPQVQILLFRIFQEALTNVRKHAHAKTVTTSLKTVEGGVLMRVTDDGSGFRLSAAEPLAGHVGLASMRERAEIAGGWYSLTSDNGRGTEISAWVPPSPNGEATTGRAGAVIAVG